MPTDPAPRERRPRALLRLGILLPQPQQPWSWREYADPDVMADDARYPVPSLPPGTLLRAMKGRRERWLWIVGGEGQTEATPPWPYEQARHRQAEGWVEAWFGAAAAERPRPPPGPAELRGSGRVTPDPQWMLAHAIRLDPRVLTLAACACARLALPVAGNHPDLVAALDAAEAWARREGTLGALRQTLRPCWRACDQFSSGSRAVQAGLAAFFAAESADPRADHYQAPEVAWRTAHALFRGDWRRDPLVYDPRIVEAVHRFVALGPVLLSKLSGVDPTWPRKDLPDGP